MSDGTRISEMTEITEGEESLAVPVVDIDGEANNRIALGEMLRSRRPGYTTWNDLRFSATAINPPGAVTDPDWDATSGGWLFDANGTETLYIIGQLPHTWLEGSVLKPHVHWEKTTAAAGAVLWRLRYQWAPIGEVREALETISGSVASVASDLADVHQITPIGDIDATGKQISDMLVMRIERVGGDALDSYGADARLLEFDIHHQIDSEGSIAEFTK